MIYYFFRISFFLLLSFIHSFIWNERHSLSKRRIFYCCSVAAVVVVVLVMVAVGAAVVFRSRFQVFCCLCRCAEAIICKFYKLESAMGRSGTNKWWIMLGGNRIVCINVCWCVCVCCCCGKSKCAFSGNWHHEKLPRFVGHTYTKQPGSRMTYNSPSEQQQKNCGIPCLSLD